MSTAIRNSGVWGRESGVEEWNDVVDDGRRSVVATLTLIVFGSRSSEAERVSSLEAGRVMFEAGRVMFEAGRVLFELGMTLSL